MFRQSRAAVFNYACASTLSYNERLLGTGQVFPYFIWPNVNPFRKAKPLVNAVIQPGKANQTVDFFWQGV